jgi:hypothetical protein
MEPAARECRVGVLNGGDTGEFFPGNGRVLPSTAAFGWWERGPGAAGRRRIAPCWVLKEQPVVVSFGALSGTMVFRGLPGMAWCGIPPAVVGFGVARIGLWVGRLLRIAQWTRASLWSSCQGRTVDALAPGADEGRGRPR